MRKPNWTGRQAVGPSGPASIAVSSLAQPFLTMQATVWCCQVVVER